MQMLFIKQGIPCKKQCTLLGKNIFVFVASVYHNMYRDIYASTIHFKNIFKHFFKNKILL